MVKRSIFTTMDKRIKFYIRNTNRLFPKPKPSFRHLKQGIKEFHKSVSWFQQTRPQTNVVFVFRLHHINTLKQELDTAYQATDSDEMSAANAHINELPDKFSVCVNEGQDKLPTMYRLPKLHKRPYKARFIANSTSCPTTELSKLLTFCLSAIKSHAIRYCETVYETSNKNWFWSIKNSGKVFSKLNCRGFFATSLSTYDFSTLYTTQAELRKTTRFDRVDLPKSIKTMVQIWPILTEMLFFISSDQSRCTLWSCHNTEKLLALR